MSEADDAITLRLSGEAKQALDWIVAKHGNIPVAEAIRRALGTEKFMLEQQDKGCSVLIEEKGGRVFEVVCR